MIDSPNKKLKFFNYFRIGRKKKVPSLLLDFDNASFKLLRLFVSI